MRRPLFGNGIPRNIQVADGEVTILDTEELNEGQVYALTLFLWIYQSGPGPFTNPTLVVSSRINGGPAVPLLACNTTYLNSFFNAVNPTRIEPIPLLQRYMVRGKQKVTLQVATDGAPSLPVIWGYFEQTGDQLSDTPSRGLQPATKLVAPFSYPPVHLVFPPGGPSTAQIIHRLDPNYIDLVTVDVAHAGADDGSFDFGSGVIVPGGLSILMPSLGTFPANGPGAYRHRVLDGIPMRANDPTDNGSALYVGGISGAAAGSSITGYGSFVRIG